MDENGTQLFGSLENGQFKAVTAETIMLQSQKIAQLVQLSEFIMAATHNDNGAGKAMVVQLGDNPQHRLIVNSNLLVPTLIVEFDKLGHQLEEEGIDLKNLLDAAQKRFQQQNPGG